MMFSANTTALAGVMASPDQEIMLEAGELVSCQVDVILENDVTAPEDAGDTAGEEEEGTPDSEPAEETGEPSAEEAPDVEELAAEDEGPASNVQEPDEKEPTNNAGKDGAEEGSNARDPLAMNSLGDVGITPLAVLPGNSRITDIFPDSVLAEEIRRQTGKTNTSRTVTQSDLNGIIYLDMNNKGLTKLEGVQYLNNLVRFAIEDNPGITSLAPFAGGNYQNLNRMQLKNCNISSLEPLTNVMTNLEVLYFENNNVDSLSALSTMTKLKIISGENNGKITSLAALSNHTDLVEVYFKNNQIESIEPLQLNTNMEVLLVENNNLDSISAVQNMTKLKRLSIYDNENIVDISPVAGKTQLTEFWAHNNKIEDISALTGLTNLVHLTLSDNKIRDLSPIQGIYPTGIYSANRQVVVLDEHEYSSLSPLILDSVVINKHGSNADNIKITPSNEGTFSNGKITWNLPAGVTKVTYTVNPQIEGL